jgi:hypothetical protein
MQASKADVKQYQAMVGSIMYAMLCTRPDLDDGKHNDGIQAYCDADYAMGKTESRFPDPSSPYLYYWRRQE